MARWFEVCFVVPLGFHVLRHLSDPLPIPGALRYAFTARQVVA